MDAHGPVNVDTPPDVAAKITEIAEAPIEATQAVITGDNDGFKQGEKLGLYFYSVIVNSLYTIFALIDHSPVGRIHSEEWA